MIVRIRPQYYARRDEDGSGSADTETRKVAVIAETLPLERLGEATAMEIVDALRKRHLIQTNAAAPPLKVRDRTNPF